MSQQAPPPQQQQQQAQAQQLPQPSTPSTLNPLAKPVTPLSFAQNKPQPQPQFNSAVIQQTLAQMQQAQWQQQQQQQQQNMVAQGQGQAQAQFDGGRYLPPHLRKGYTAGGADLQMPSPPVQRGGYQRSFSYGGSAPGSGVGSGYQAYGGGRGGMGGGMGGQLGGAQFGGGYGQQSGAFQRSRSDSYARGAYGGGRGGYGGRGGQFGGYSGSRGGGMMGRGGMNAFSHPETDPFDTKDVSMPTSGINFEAYEDIPVETSGREVPKPIEKFDEVDLGETLKENIRRCKYEKPTPVQRYSIPIGIAGRDLMACAQTGSGKTAAFCFPIVARIFTSGLPLGERRRKATPYALILSPTRELSMQIHEELRKFTYQSMLKTVVVYGGAPVGEQLRNLERGCDMLVATPGRLNDLMERGRVALNQCIFLCLDEADRMLDMGFEPQIRQIVEKEDMPPSGQRQTLLFSATFPKEIQRLASDFLSDYVFLTVGRVGSSTDLIVQHVERVSQADKRSVLLDLVTAVEGLTLVFSETKKGADQLEAFLLQNNFAATSIHGDRSQQEREFALRSFKSGRTPILVATDVAARGLDIPHVTHVINYDLPTDIDDYVHRIGRTGRAGKKGLATCLFSEKDSGLARALVETLSETNQDVPSWLQAVAASSAPYGSKNKRNNNKFGGRDFRRDFSGNSSGGGNFNRSQASYNGGGGGGNAFFKQSSANAGASQYQKPQSGNFQGNYGVNPYDSAWA